MDQPFRDSMEAALARAEQTAEAATRRADELDAEVQKLRNQVAATPTNASAFTKRVNEDNEELREQVRELREKCASLESRLARVGRGTTPIGLDLIVTGLERVYRAVTRTETGDDSKPPPGSKR